MTELLWEGKYEKDGTRPAPLRVPLPFQTIETVNESAQERQHALDLLSAAVIRVGATGSFGATRSTFCRHC